MIPEALITQIEKNRVIAVLVIDDANQAVPLANALLEGGIRAMELTLRTPAAIESISQITKAFPDMLVGAGTVLTPDQAKKAKDAGAAFAVAPGCNPNVLEAAKTVGLPFGPGIMTPSEIEKALEYDCRLLKFFPAETTGGLPHLKSMAAPYQHLGIKFIPLGGLNASNAGAYLASPLVAAIGGSWIASRKEIQSGDWASITAKAKEALSL